MPRAAKGEMAARAGGGKEGESTNWMRKMGGVRIKRPRVAGMWVPYRSTIQPPMGERTKGVTIIRKRREAWVTGREKVVRMWIGIVAS